MTDGDLNMQSGTVKLYETQGAPFINNVSMLKTKINLTLQ